MAADIDHSLHLSHWCSDICFPGSEFFAICTCWFYNISNSFPEFSDCPDPFARSDSKTTGKALLNSLLKNPTQLPVMVSNEKSHISHKLDHIK